MNGIARLFFHNCQISPGNKFFFRPGAKRFVLAISAIFLIASSFSKREDDSRFKLRLETLDNKVCIQRKMCHIISETSCKCKLFFN